MSEAHKGHLSGAKKATGRHEAHIKSLTDGFHVTKHHPDGSETEHAAESLDDAMDHVKDHMNEAQSMDPEASQDPQAAAGQGAPDPNEEKPNC